MWDMLKGKQTGPSGLSKYVLMKLTVGVYFAVIREIADVSGLGKGQYRSQGFNCVGKSG